MNTTNDQVLAFLVGAHRSGTTLLGLMLDSHPDLSWFHHFEWVVKYIQPDGQWPTVEEYKQILRSDQGFQSWNLSIKDDYHSYSEIVDGFLSQRRERDQKNFSGATIHSGYRYLLRIWPNAKFIHVVRDPRDTAQSTLKAGWSGNAWGAAKRWRQAETEWNALCELTDDDKRLVIKFEELVSKPAETLQKITKFIGLAYTDEMFAYTKHTPYSYPDPKMAFKWRSKVSPRDIRMVELASDHLLDKYGYERTSQSVSASVFEKTGLELSDRLNKFQRRVNHYGVGVWFAQFLARRLGNPPQLEWALQKVDEIDSQKLKASSGYVADPKLSK